MSTRNKTPENNNHSFPIVGIGASAGGLDAYKSFFQAMPADSGLAFVLIQHLAPDYESLMVDLLSKCTAMPVSQATDGQRVQPDHVYMIPPNRSLTIRSGVLQLTEPVERRGMRMAIDTFLRSLAGDQQERAIGIILSGTGSDGSEGLKAIKAHGGLTLVQEPATAAHDGMPRSAIATGLVDIVHPVERMPEVLTYYAEHPYVNGNGPHRVLIGGAGRDLNGLLALLLTRRGIDFRHYEHATLLRRIERRMGLNHLETLAEYLTLLRQQPAEVERLAKDLMIGVTGFFRDPEVFEALAEQVMQKLVASAPTGATLRVWVPGCATGEEAYTLAMLLNEQITAQKKSLTLQIFASDINEDALEVARAGRYPAGSAADLTPHRLDLHFSKTDGDSDQLTVRKALRESVVFARQNLLADPPFSRLDLISCRNLMIYLQQPVQEKLTALFHFALKADGYLLLGSSESIDRHAEMFRPVAKKSRLYQRISTPSLKHPELPFSPSDPLPHSGAKEPVPGLRERRPRLAELASRWVLEEYAPATVIVNQRFEALYFCGNVDRYLRYPHGEPNLNVLDMVHESLVTQLRAALQRVFELDQPVELGRVRIRCENQYQLLRLRVKPLRHKPGGEGLAMISFIDIAEAGYPPAAADELYSETADTTETLLIRQIEDELKTTREDLQSMLQEMETSNEELKASNEEVMSINEELQSSNEALETSKEELQSLNEELITLNSQLREKIAELEQLHNDMNNLLNSTDVATLFLDLQLRIKRFTETATRLFHLIPTDIGRPLEDLAQRFADPELLSSAGHVLKTSAPSGKEVEASSGSWFARRILPYCTEDNKIAGVVVTFTDITELRVRARQQALIAELGRLALAGIEPQTLLDDAVNKVAEGLNVEYSKVLELLPDQKALLLKAGSGWQEGLVGSARVSSDIHSQAGYTLLVSTPAEAEAMTVGPVVFVEDLQSEQRFRGPELLTVHQVVSGLSVAIPGTRQPYGVLGAHSTGKRIFTSEDGDFLRAVAHILASAIERWHVEARLRERAEEIQTLLDTLPVGVFIAHDPQAQRITGNKAAELLLRSPRAGNLSKTAPEPERPGNFKVCRDGSELPPADLPVQRAARGVFVQQEEVDHVFEDGSVIHTLVSAAPLFDAHDNVRGAVASIMDISGRKKAEQALFEQKERARVTLVAIGDAVVTGVITTGIDSRIEYLNPVAEKLTCWSLSEARNRALGDVFQMINETTGEPVTDPVTRCLASNQAISREDYTTLINRHDHQYAVEVSAAPIHDRNRRILGAVLVFHDVTEQRRLTREISYQASHDMLTGLLNRREFERRLQRVIDTTQDEYSHHVLCYLDLDQFKMVNDTSGHAAGDELLRQVTGLFRKNRRQRDTLARLGGDEFGLLFEHCSLEQAQLTAEKLRLELEEFLFVWEDQSFRVSVSIGLVPVNAVSGNLDEILQTADSACYVAKKAGRNRVQIYSAEGDLAVARHHGELRWISRINDALAEDRFTLFVQRIVPLASKPEGTAQKQYCELLLRLIDSGGQMIEPDIFMPVAERYQLCSRIDRWVIDHAFHWLAGHPQYLQQLELCAINLSGHSLSDQTFQDHVLAQLDAFALPAARICFEITETAAIANLTHATRFIKTLRTRGCRFSLDDFGSGLSSFAYLKNLPVDFLKIDGLFVKDIADDPIDRAMVRSINEIAQLMGKQTIAEYVENTTILQHLRELGIDYAQGFGIDQPQPLEP